jgi:hypothetical protein
MAGTLGKGTTIGHSPTSGGTYVTVANVKGIKPGKISVGKADTTTFSDNSDQYIPNGFVNGGTYEFDLLYVTAATTSLYPMVGTLAWWEVTLADTHVWAFQAFIDGWEPGIPLKDVVNEKITMTITGDPTYT